MTDLKKIVVLNFSGSTSEWEGWHEKFLACAKRKGYNNLLVGTDSVPTQSKYEAAVTAIDAAVKDLAQKNEEAFEDIILSIDHIDPKWRVAFSLVKNCKSAEYPEGN